MASTLLIFKFLDFLYCEDSFPAISPCILNWPQYQWFCWVTRQLGIKSHWWNDYLWVVSSCFNSSLFLPTSVDSFSGLACSHSFSLNEAVVLLSSIHTLLLCSLLLQFPAQVPYFSSLDLLKSSYILFPFRSYRVLTSRSGIPSPLALF